MYLVCSLMIIKPYWSINFPWVIFWGRQHAEKKHFFLMLYAKQHNFMLNFKKLGLILFPRGDSNLDDIEKSQELSQENEYLQDFDHYKLVSTTTRPIECCLMRNCHSFTLLRSCQTNQGSGEHLWHMRWIPYWVILSRLHTAEWGKWLFPSIHHLWAQISTIVSSLGHFSTRKTLLN